MTGKTREQLIELLDRAEEKNAIAEVSELQYRLKTVCANCGREGAEDHYDQQGVYAGRWHARCATPADRVREAYRWNPAEDEPLEEDY